MGSNIFLHYDPPSDSWSTISTGSSAFYFGYYTAAAVVDGKIIISRGYLGGAGQENIKVYDPVSNKWSYSTAATSIWDGAATAYRDKLYIFAGRSDPNRMEVYSIKEDTTLTNL